MPELCELAVEILVYGIKAFLQFFFSEFADGVMSGIVIHIWEEDRLGEGGFNVFAGAAISVTTCSNLFRPSRKHCQNTDPRVLRDGEERGAYLVVE